MPTEWCTKPYDQFNRYRKGIWFNIQDKLNKLGIERMYLNTIKAIYNKLSTSHWTRKAENLLRCGIRHKHLLSFSFNILLKVPAREIMQETGHSNRRGRSESVTVCQPCDHKYKTPSNSTKKLMLINSVKFQDVCKNPHTILSSISIPY
jgi:hypothetical protein